MEIVRLKKEHYDALLALLNEVFTLHNKKEADFEKDLPKMCVRDDEHMGKHFGIFDHGKLVSAIGIYPLPTVIAGEECLFSTVGNVATHPDFEGKGYMNILLEHAMTELERIGADASRLGGLRHRYNRFGYELCGTRYTFTFNERNRKNRFPVGMGDDVTFERIEKGDTERLRAAWELHRAHAFSTLRSAENGFAEMYLAMTAWQNIPYVAQKNGKTIGYLCVNARGDTLAESYAESPEAFVQMICAWQRHCGVTVYFHLFPCDVECVRLFAERAEAMVTKAPCLFKIVNWEKIVSALMKLRSTYTRMMEGELKIAIKDYGVLRLFVDGERVGCERIEGDANVVLDRLQAARYLFGPLPPMYVANDSPVARDWLPLPLSWNLQDRV